MAECKSDVLRGLFEYRAWAPTILRVFFGFFIMMHGIGKLWGPNAGIGPGMEGWLGMTSGMSIPTFLAYAAAWGEFIVGILLILGLWVRYGSIIGAIIMLVAMIMVKFPQGFLGAELDLLYFAAFISLLITGGGKLALQDVFANMAEKK